MAAVEFFLGFHLRVLTLLNKLIEPGSSEKGKRTNIQFFHDWTGSLAALT